MHELISILRQFLSTLGGVGYAICASSTTARHHPGAKLKASIDLALRPLIPSSGFRPNKAPVLSASEYPEAVWDISADMCVCCGIHREVEVSVLGKASTPKRDGL